MSDMSNVKKTAIWSSVITTGVVVVILSLMIQVPMPAIVASISLVSVGAAVVGALVALSFDEENEH